ncbi:MAG: SDR family oxidoreductase [Proteobacteria bacterium]|uniref:SDR family NAD(P)-dependent oxidoreductase n=1 Tax=Zoogloea sp. LCSB751 TaxID=1965277 RepID=UPI0009A54DE2|nr:glucose 1-dehydrogenase [Zoogloea sp. LCSB751]MBS0345695.1 SDR family oxidoreductase [Pseudomonadota bacterium]
MKRLAGRVVLVTGAARGMGATMARLFHAEGASVVIADILDADGAALADELGDGALFQHLDVTEEADWQRVVSDVLECWGSIDGLVNNAGINFSETLAKTGLADFRRVVDVNLVGPFLGIKHVGPAMAARGYGRIVNISSIGGMTAWNSMGAYCASKWGLRGLSRVAALELGQRGVRVNSIHPGGIDTSMGSMFDGDTDALDKAYRSQPVPRIGRPIEIARMALFLLGEEASYVCGAEMVVDGGNLAGRYFDGLPGAPATT